MASDFRPAEQPAVKTTIVGGRPPGSGKAVGPIPRGIEVLIKKAAVDPAFKMLLLAKRDEAANRIDLTLDPAEAMMLRAAPRAQLEAIIAQTSVHPSVLPAFLGRAAAVMLVALGAGTLGCDKVPVTDGIAPDRPPAKKVEPPQPPKATQSTPSEPAPQSYGVAGIQPAAPERIEPTDGIRPIRPPEAKPKAETPKPPAPQPQPPAPTGIRPDRPPAAKPAADEPPAAAPSEVKPPTPQPKPKPGDGLTRGIRPDRPPTTKGIRPDRPKSKGE